jgi:hypothetical protein
MPIQIIDCGTKKKQNANFPFVRYLHNSCFNGIISSFLFVMVYWFDEAKAKKEVDLIRNLPLIEQNLLI